MSQIVNQDPSRLEIPSIQRHIPLKDALERLEIHVKNQDLTNTQLGLLSLHVHTVYEAQDKGFFRRIWNAFQRCFRSYVEKRLGIEHAYEQLLATIEKTKQEKNYEEKKNVINPKQGKKFAVASPLTPEQEAELQYELDVLGDLKHEAPTRSSSVKVSAKKAVDPEMLSLLAELPTIPLSIYGFEDISAEMSRLFKRTPEIEQTLLGNIGDKKLQKPFDDKLKSLNATAKKKMKKISSEDLLDKAKALHESIGLMVGISKEMRKLHAMLKLSQKSREPGKQKQIGEAIAERMASLTQAKQKVDLARETMQKQITEILSLTK